MQDEAIDGRTDIRTDIIYHRDSKTYLKKKNNWEREVKIYKLKIEHISAKRKN